MDNVHGPEPSPTNGLSHMRCRSPSEGSCDIVNAGNFHSHVTR